GRVRPAAETRRPCTPPRQDRGVSRPESSTSDCRPSTNRVRCAPDVVCSSSREGDRATLAHRVTRNLRREEVSTMKKGHTSWLFGLALGVGVVLATALAFTVTPVARGDTPTPATYTDPVGDMQGAGAPDITSVTVGDTGG